MKKFTYPEEEMYLNAWRYLMTIGAGFHYCRAERWVSPDEECSFTYQYLRDLGGESSDLVS